VSVGAKVGILVLLRVSGAVKEGGGILSFGAKDDGRFFANLPVDFTYRFNNSGNDRVKPEGIIRIANIFGLESATLNANPVLGNILPGSTRRFDVNWGDTTVDPAALSFFGKVGYEWNNFAFGIYRAHLDLKYGTDKTSSSVYTVFVLPWQLLLIVLIVLAVLITIFAFGLKKYNRWIVSRAKLG
jgi:hypothetical protein